MLRRDLLKNVGILVVPPFLAKAKDRRRSYYPLSREVLEWVETKKLFDKLGIKGRVVGLHVECDRVWYTTAAVRRHNSTNALVAYILSVKGDVGKATKTPFRGDVVWHWQETVSFLRRLGVSRELPIQEMCVLFTADIVKVYLTLYGIDDAPVS